ncbi:MAG TPA: phosphonate C-P lyase system protein PhnH [Streptosporangiaceae bacterium]
MSAPPAGGTAAGADVRAVARTAEQTQVDFRVLLDALSRPGTIGRLDAPAGAPAATVPAAGLADVEVRLAVYARPGDQRWAAAVYAATGAPYAGPEEARMVLALRPPTPDELRALPRGDALAPELGARLVIAVGALRHSPEPGDVALTLRGPGVRDTAALAVSGLDAAVFAALEEVNAGFPAGVDTFLVAADGTVAGLPRTTRIEITGTSDIEMGDR